MSSLVSVFYVQRLWNYGGSPDWWRPGPDLSYGPTDRWDDSFRKAESMSEADAEYLVNRLRRAEGEHATYQVLRLDLQVVHRP